MKTRRIIFYLTPLIVFILLLIVNSTKTYILGFVFTIVLIIIEKIMESIFGQDEKGYIMFLNFLSYALILTMIILSLLIIPETLGSRDIILNLLSILIFIFSLVIRNHSVDFSNRRIQFIMKSEKTQLINRVEMYFVVLAFVLVMYIWPKFDPSGNIMNMFWIILLLDNMLSLFEKRKEVTHNQN